MKASHTTFAAVIGLTTIGLAVSAPANAAVYVGFQSANVNGGAITTEATGGATAIASASYGVFNTNSVIGQVGPLPDLLDSLSVNQITASGSGTLNIFVTNTGFTSPFGSNVLFDSGLTVNEIPTGWTVQERTFLDSNDGTYTTATLLGDRTFNSIGSMIQLDAAPTGPGPYSVTEEYTIHATGAGNTSGTIDLSSPVPEPATWAMFLLGFLGVGFMVRSARRENTIAIA
jgi:hypothetical protein